MNKLEAIMARATARHILVETQEQCEKIKKQIEDGGDLGEFSQGQMVKEFDDVVFSGDLGTIHGPIQTQFGFHLIEITSRDL